MIDIDKLEHISSEEFGRNLDAITDRITREDIAMVIDHGDKSFVIHPAHWLLPCSQEQFDTLVTCTVRYLMSTNGNASAWQTVLSSLPWLSDLAAENLYAELTHSQSGGELPKDVLDVLRQLVYERGVQDYGENRDVTMVVEVETGLYDKVSAILKPHGLSMADAIRLFLKETVARGEIPFQYTEEDLQQAKASKDVQVRFIEPQVQ